MNTTNSRVTKDPENYVTPESDAEYHRLMNDVHEEFIFEIHQEIKRKDEDILLIQRALADVQAQRQELINQLP